MNNIFNNDFTNYNNNTIPEIKPIFTNIPTIPKPKTIDYSSFGILANTPKDFCPEALLINDFINTNY